MASSKKITDFLTNWDDSPEQLELFIENASLRELEILCQRENWWGIIEKVVVLYKIRPQHPKIQFLLNPLEAGGVQRILLDSLTRVRTPGVITVANLCSGSQLPLPARAVFYLLSEQRTAYEDLDPDRTLFREYLNRLTSKHVPAVLHQTLLETLKQLGRTDLLLDLPKYTANFLNPAKLDQNNIEKLFRDKRFEQLWELAREAAPCWSIFILKKLTKIGWQPSEVTAQTVFNKLTILAEKIPADVLYQLRDEFPLTNHVQVYTEGWERGDLTHTTRILPGGNFLIREVTSDPASWHNGINTLQLCTIEPFEALKTFQILLSDDYIASHAPWYMEADEARISDFEVSQDKSFIAIVGYWGWCDWIVLRAAIWVFSIIEDRPPLCLYFEPEFGRGRLTISPDNSLLLISNGSTLILYRYTEQELIEIKRATFPAQDNFYPQELVFSPDGKTLVINFINNNHRHNVPQPRKIQLWRMPDLEFVREVEVKSDNYSLYNLKFSPDSKLLLVGPYLKWIWVSDEKFCYQTEAEHPTVGNMTFSPDGKLLVMSYAKNYISLHHMEGAFSCQLKVLEGRIISLEFDEAGKTLYIFDSNFMLYSLNISLLQLYSLPISFTRFKDLERLARSQTLTANQQILHDFITAQMQAKWQYDVELEVLRPLTAQEKDIELD